MSQHNTDPNMHTHTHTHTRIRPSRVPQLEQMEHARVPALLLHLLLRPTTFYFHVLFYYRNQWN